MPSTKRPAFFDKGKTFIVTTWGKITHVCGPTFSRIYEFLYDKTLSLRERFGILSDAVTSKLFEFAEEKPKRFIASLTVAGLLIGIALTMGTQTTYHAMKERQESQESIIKKYGFDFTDFNKEDITDSVKRKTSKEDIFGTKKEFVLFLYTENTENYEYLKTMDTYRKSGTKLPLVLLQSDTAEKVDESIALRDGGIELLHIRNGKEVNRLTGQIPMALLPKGDVVPKEATVHKSK